MIDFTPELKAEALKLRVAATSWARSTRRRSVGKWEGPRATLGLPTLTGGANWQGGALDPETNTFYIFTNNQMGIFGLIPGDPARTDMRYVSGQPRDPAASLPRRRRGGGARRPRRGAQPAVVAPRLPGASGGGAG